jgi:hypothetical protein
MILFKKQKDLEFHLLKKSFRIRILIQIRIDFGRLDPDLDLEGQRRLIKIEKSCRKKFSVFKRWMFSFEG